MWIHIQNKLFNLNNAISVSITDKIWEDYEEKELGYWVLKVKFLGKDNSYLFKMRNRDEAQAAFDVISKSIPGSINII
jgi:hypothetical protein